MKFQMFKLDLEKAEEPVIKLPTFVGLSKNQESSKKKKKKKFTSALLTMSKSCGSPQSYVDHEKRWAG